MRDLELLTEVEVRTAFHQMSSLANLAKLEWGVGVHPKLTGYAVQAILHWTLGELKRDARQWYQQSHQLLQMRYVCEMSNTMYADAVGLSLRQANKRGQKAVERATKIIRTAASHTTWRQEMARLRWAACSALERQALHFWALLDAPVSDAVGGEMLTAHTAQLVEKRLLIAGEQRGTWRIDPEMRQIALRTSAEAHTSDQQAQLHLLRGRVLRQTKNLDSAIASFEQVISIADVTTIYKVEAYYELAKAYQQKDVQAAKSAYKRCRDYLGETDSEAKRQLLAQLLIDEAALHIEHLADATAAARLLSKAEPYLCADWFAIQSDWHDVWALTLRRSDLKVATAHQWEAYLFARESADTERIMLTSYNLGIIYTHQGRFATAYEHLTRSCALAEQRGDKRRVGLSEKGLGERAYGVRDYSQAAEHYRAAYDCFTTIQDRHWLAATCYDLAEVLAQLAQPLAAADYWQQAHTIACEAGTQPLLIALDQLTDRFPELLPQLNVRQRQAVVWMRHQSAVSNREYREEFEVSKKSAENDLGKLVTAGVVRRTGQGRSTAYYLQCCEFSA